MLLLLYSMSQSKSQDQFRIKEKSKRLILLMGREAFAHKHERNCRQPSLQTIYYKF